MCQQVRFNKSRKVYILKLLIIFHWGYWCFVSGRVIFNAILKKIPFVTCGHMLFNCPKRKRKKILMNSMKYTECYTELYWKKKTFVTYIHMLLIYPKRRYKKIFMNSCGIDRTLYIIPSHNAFFCQNVYINYDNSEAVILCFDFQSASLMWKIYVTYVCSLWIRSPGKEIESCPWLLFHSQSKAVWKDN